MNTFGLILLRMYAVTFGRIPACAFLIKKLLVFFLIRCSKNKYVAASSYFDYKRLQKEAKDPHGG